MWRSPARKRKTCSWCEICPPISLDRVPLPIDAHARLCSAHRRCCRSSTSASSRRTPRCPFAPLATSPRSGQHLNFPRSQRRSLCCYGLFLLGCDDVHGCQGAQRGARPPAGNQRPPLHRVSFLRTKSCGCCCSCSGGLKLSVSRGDSRHLDEVEKAVNQFPAYISSFAYIIKELRMLSNRGCMPSLRSISSPGCRRADSWRGLVIC